MADTHQDNRRRKVSPPTHDDPRPTTIRWRWYHFYFLLALFDLVVILASLGLYHATLSSYDRALRGLSELEAVQQWIASIRLAVIELNAPGNDVFESRDVGAERARFDDTRTRLMLLFRRESEFGIDLTSVRNQIESMAVQEELIFTSFETISGEIRSDEDPRKLLSSATVSMAAMDRHQANAVSALSNIERNLQEQQSRLVAGYGTQLEKSASLEKYFLAIVVLILGGVFWYGRKLQRMHEQMIENHQRAIEERHERLASVGEVCSAVSHGIRNPLAAITSSAQLALEFGTLDDATRLRIKDVLTEGKRLNERINRLLTFAGGAESRGVHFNICEIVENAVAEMAPNIQEKNVNLETRFESRPLMTFGNPDEVVQAIIELVSNSLDHLATGGSLSVSCLRDENRKDRVSISVIDNGPGIPEEIREYVFDLFFTTKAQGNGIGLASVRRTVESHNGRVFVEPTLNGGAHIRAELPLSE